MNIAQRFVRIALVLAPLTIAACSASPSASDGVTEESSDELRAADARIKILHGAFDPSTLTIRPGTVIRFTNDDPSSHTLIIEGDSGSSLTRTVRANRSIRIKFAAEGSYFISSPNEPTLEADVTVAAAPTQGGGGGNSGGGGGGGGGGSSSGCGGSGGSLPPLPGMGFVAPQNHDHCGGGGGLPPLPGGG